MNIKCNSVLTFDQIVNKKSCSNIASVNNTVLHSCPIKNDKFDHSNQYSFGSTNDYTHTYVERNQFINVQMQNKWK